MNIPSGKQGFTLIEILVVTSIISLLSSVVITATTGARDKAEVANGQRFDRNVMSVLADNLVAEWTFEDPTSLGSDTSGFNQNFTPGVGASAGSGKRNSSNYLTCAANTANTCMVRTAGLDLKNNNPRGMTISLWVRLNSNQDTDSYNFLNSNWTPTGSNAGFYFGKPLGSYGIGKIAYFYRLGAQSQNDRLTNNTLLKPNQWYNLVVTVDGSISAGTSNAFLYANGKLLGSSYIAFVPGSLANNLLIGGSSVMDVDDVRVFATPLSQLSVEDLYNAENAVARK